MILHIYHFLISFALLYVDHLAFRSIILTISCDRYTGGSSNCAPNNRAFATANFGSDSGADSATDRAPNYSISINSECGHTHH